MLAAYLLHVGDNVDRRTRRTVAEEARKWTRDKLLA